MGEHPEDAALAPSTLAGALFHESGDALFVVDPISERLLDANKAALRLTGFGRDELLRLSVRALVRHEQEWQDWQIGPPATSTPLPGSDSYLLRTREERWLPVSVNVTRLQLPGREPLALCRMRDRREQVESQRRLQRAEAELRRLLGTISDAVYSARLEPDGRWRFLSVSPRFGRLTGRALAGLVDTPQPREQAIVVEDLPRWHALLARVEAGQPGEAEYRLRRPDGSVVWVHESAVVVPEEGGVVIHGVLGDISDRKRAEDVSLRRDPARLEGVARLAATVAHDFSNFLTSIVGNVNLARLNADALPECLDRIDAVTHRATEQCRLLATLAGKTVRTAAATDLVALARELADPRCRVEQHGEVPPVAGDAASLRELLRRLLDNALEAQQGHPGEVRLVVRGGGGEGPFVWVEVIDSGLGLTPEARAHLFEPYFTTKPGHRGLGLAVVAGIARGLGGVVEVSAPLEGGTVVRVKLPETADVGAGHQAPAPPPAGTVLLIDDEPSVRDVSSRLLGSLGFQVLAAESGEQGLALLRDNVAEVRLALIDWHLPGLGGEQLMQQLRPLSPEMPIIVMSGAAEQDLLPRLSGLGLAGYLQKPFRLGALAEMLRPLLPRG